ncbi:ABC transporter ATP-binding protein [Luteimonas huabeiensis]|uniref:ABC transporter ATP-binding protein n=1 Tax=Luteimonas huabeiensis TaxID=1244513 RepID=UPI0004640977|nr:ABC transporter ATP-binding protein [Luteimonas huabeiensis]
MTACCSPRTPEPEPLALLRGVRRRRGAVQALDGIDLELPGGRLTALLGVNGAGKSTAIEVLLGLQPADAGEAALFGLPPRARGARERTGAMLQQAQLPERLTAGELLQLVRSYYPAPRSVADCVALAGLDGLMGRRYGRLSGGQQRRVQFALALCGRPRLLFLDEPTTGLDAGARAQVWRAIRELVAGGAAVLLTTHYLEEAEALADRVVVLDRGRLIAAGELAAVRGRVSRRRVACRCALAPETVAGWPGVHRAVREGERLVAACDDAESLVRRLLDADPALAELEVSRAGLADAFAAMTGTEAAREDAA